MPRLTRLFLIAMMCLCAVPAIAQEKEKEKEKEKGEEKEKEKEKQPDLDLLNKAVALHSKALAARKGKDEAAAKKLWDQALAACNELATKHPDSKYWGMALFNAGYFQFRCLGRAEDAIKTFRRLIDNPKVNDKDPTGSVMAPYRNYRYKSWQWIVDAEESLKRPARAISGTFKFRDAFVTHCATCHSGMYGGFLKRLTGLCRSLLLEGEGKVVSKADARALSDAITAALEAEKEEEPVAADLFLLRMGKRYNTSKQPVQAGRVLRMLVDTFPKSKHLAVAKELLEAISKDKNK